MELPGGPEDVGQPSACVVADLDNDGFVDVLQPGERGSTLWLGKAGGFERPVHVNIATGGGTALAALGDFAQNGRLGVFLAGQEKNTLWESDGKGRFRDVCGFSGSISYKCPPGASAVQVMDLNHDGRQDLCLAYEQNDLLYHFNRGFRSFAEEGELRLPGTQTNPGAAAPGTEGRGLRRFQRRRLQRSGGTLDQRRLVLLLQRSGGSAGSAAAPAPGRDRPGHRQLLDRGRSSSPAPARSPCQGTRPPRTLAFARRVSTRSATAYRGDPTR